MPNELLYQPRKPVFGNSVLVQITKTGFLGWYQMTQNDKELNDQMTQNDKELNDQMTQNDKVLNDFFIY